jgi:transposase-like protein
MGDFKWRHYQGQIILSCVRWYCKYGISYRDLEEMMIERGVEVDHTTLYRWVQYCAPLIEKRLRYFWRPSLGLSWRVDETYIKVKGQWKYLYRAVDKRGHMLDFYLSSAQNIQAAKRFLSKALQGLKD